MHGHQLTRPGGESHFGQALDLTQCHIHSTPVLHSQPDECLTNYDPHGYCVIYSAADRSSFSVAEQVLQVLWTNQNIAQKAVILVSNKADLARSRLVTSEGKYVVRFGRFTPFINTRRCARLSLLKIDIYISVFKPI